MTLVLATNISKRFAFMTSDTRRVRAYYNHNLENNEIEVDNEGMTICPVKDIKSHKLSNFVLAGAGGTFELSTYLTDRLKEEVKPEHDLADCKEILASIVKRARALENPPEYFRYLDVKEGVSVILNGFYRDGCTGIVHFTSGKDPDIDEFISSDGHYQYSAIAPAKEYLRKTKELFYIPQLYDASLHEGVPDKEFGNFLFKTVLDHLVMMHGVASFNYPVEISPDFEVHTIVLNNGVYEYATREYDLSETFKEYDKIRRQIES